METSSKADAARKTGVSVVTTATNRSQGQDRARRTGGSGKKVRGIDWRNTDSETELKKVGADSCLLLFSKFLEQTLLLQYNVLSVKHENNCFIL